MAAESLLTGGHNAGLAYEHASASTLDGKRSDGTPEFSSFKRFIAQHASDPLGAFPPDAIRIERLSSLQEGDVTFLGGPDCDTSEGARPVIIADGLRDWPALRKWTPAFLAERFGDDEVFANDRAPARPTDADEGRPQVTVRVTLRDFLAYLSASSAPPGRPAAAVAAAAPPFYLNGWAALAAHPGEVGADCPPPYFSELIDHNDLILEQLDKQLFSSASAGGRRQQQQAGEAPAGAASEASWAAAAASAGGGAWWRRLSLGLSKLFLGPAGIVTRLHYDAGDAHGWLGQIWGRKLFVLYPPSASPSLYVLNPEAANDKTVTVQSPVDPLNVDPAAHPLAAALAPHVAVLGPGEVLVVPRGWWHYAVALEPSLTAMRNFYHAESNAAALVQFVMEKVKVVFASRNRIAALAALREAMDGESAGAMSSRDS